MATEDTDSFPGKPLTSGRLLRRYREMPDKEIVKLVMYGKAAQDPRLDPTSFQNSTAMQNCSRPLTSQLTFYRFVFYEYEQKISYHKEKIGGKLQP
jgi:hypothetical protein